MGSIPQRLAEARGDTGEAERLYRTAVTLRDQLGVELNGDHEFQRVNPAVGLTYAATPALTLYE
mgnify:CR=1 FL=1